MSRGLSTHIKHNTTQYTPQCNHHYPLSSACRGPVPWSRCSTNGWRRKRHVDSSSRHLHIYDLTSLGAARIVSRRSSVFRVFVIVIASVRLNRLGTRKCKRLLRRSEWCANDDFHGHAPNTRGPCSRSSVKRHRHILTKDG